MFNSLLVRRHKVLKKTSQQKFEIILILRPNSSNFSHFWNTASIFLELKNT